MQAELQVPGSAQSSVLMEKQQRRGSGNFGGDNILFFYPDSTMC